MTFGKTLREKRTQKKLNRVDLSKKTGISYSRLNALEADIRPETIELETAIRISETLRWDLKDIANLIRPNIKWSKE